MLRITQSKRISRRLSLKNLSIWLKDPQSKGQNQSQSLESKQKDSHPRSMIQFSHQKRSLWCYQESQREIWSGQLSFPKNLLGKRPIETVNNNLLSCLKNLLAPKLKKIMWVFQPMLPSNPRRIPFKKEELNQSSLRHMEANSLSLRSAAETAQKAQRFQGFSSTQI